MLHDIYAALLREHSVSSSHVQVQGATRGRYARPKLTREQRVCLRVERSRVQTHARRNIAQGFEPLDGAHVEGMNDAVDPPVEIGRNAIGAGRQLSGLELQQSGPNPENSRGLQLKLSTHTPLAAIAEGLYPNLRYVGVDVVEVHRPEIVFGIADRLLGHASLEHRRRR